MRDRASLQNNNDFLYIASHDGFSIFVSLSKEIYLFLENNETFYLTFFSVKKEAKKLFSGQS